MRVMRMTGKGVTLVLQCTLGSFFTGSGLHLVLPSFLVGLGKSRGLSCRSDGTETKHTSWRESAWLKKSSNN